MQATGTSGPAQPPIHLTDADYDLIASLAISMERRAPDFSRMVLNEINRAEIHSAGTLPADVVTLGSEVEFLDVTCGAMRRIRLVLPADADIEAGLVSIMTPMGAGLIGLRKGQSIDWPRSDGSRRELRILQVVPATV